MFKTTITITLCGLALIANAQSNFGPNSRFTDNWSIGIEGGLQTNLNEFHTPQGGIFGINVNKDLTPYYGFSIEALCGINNSGNWFVPQAHFHNGTAIDNLTGFITGRWNVSNTFGGFKGGRRFFEIETNVGVGYGKFFANKEYVDPWNAFQFKAGLNLNFYLGESKAWAINIRPAAVWNLSSTGEFDSRLGVGQLTAGVTYHFKTSNGTHFYVKSETQALQDEIAQMRLINESIQNQIDSLPKENEVVVEKVIEKVVQEVEVPTYIDNTFLINFALNSAELIGDAKTTLNRIPKDSKVTVAGYASPEGNKEYNLKLSDLRAETVKAYLESRGVKVEKTVGYGADNIEANRIVIVTIIK